MAFKSGSLKVIQVNLVVFFVRTYELYIYRSHAKYDPNDQAILVSLNVEHVKVVANCIDVTEHLSGFVEIRPIALFHNGVPVIQLILNSFVFIGKLSKRSIANDDHGDSFLGGKVRAKVADKFHFMK